jgi:putative spermidine/putrescine transport system permease protein
MTADTTDDAIADLAPGEQTGEQVKEQANERANEQAETLGRRLSRLAHALNRPSRLTLMSYALCAPLLLLLAVCFVVPLLFVMHTALHNPVVGDAWPEFIEALREDHDEVPGEPVFRALVGELQRQQKDDAYKLTLKPFSQQTPELWRLLQHTTDTLPPEDFPSAKAWFIGSDPAWAEPGTWKVIRRVAAPYTTHNLVNALDVTLNPDGNLRLKPEERRGYSLVIRDTLVMGFWVTLLALLLGYPLAYRLVTMRRTPARILLSGFLVLLWTSVLVKTYGWMTVFDRHGVINEILMGIGFIEEPLALRPSWALLMVAMIYALLPFMILPIYQSMRRVSLDQLRAAVSLGAPPARAVLTAYLPATTPGIAAGCLLVFILSIGYYTLPATAAGAAETTISMLLVEFAITIANNGMAATMASFILIIAGILFWFYMRTFAPIRGEITRRAPQRVNAR